MQLILNLYIVPTSQNLAQDYLRNSSLEFFPKLIEEKKFTNVMNNLTIFVEEYDEGGNLKGIYIKEKLKNDESKIIIANKGKLIKDNNSFSFKLLNGKITNLVNKNDFSIDFKETTYNLSNLDSKTRKLNKLDEETSSVLLSCLEKHFNDRKDSDLRCGSKSYFLINDIYEEVFKRIINPLYILVLSLISSLIVLKSKFNNFSNYFKSFLFFLGFAVILFSELSYKFIGNFRI